MLNQSGMCPDKWSDKYSDKCLENDPDKHLSNYPDTYFSRDSANKPIEACAKTHASA